jgi:hypothetical protein
MGDKDYVRPDAHIAYDLATMQERLGWPRVPDPLNGDDVRNHRTDHEDAALMAVYDATGRWWGHYPEIPPLEFFAQPKLASTILQVSAEVEATPVVEAAPVVETAPAVDAGPPVGAVLAFKAPKKPADYSHPSIKVVQNKHVEPEEALAIFSASVKREADIKREIVEGSVITWCPMCLTAVAPQEPVCLYCKVNLEPVLRPKRLLTSPEMKLECAAFIDELHQM